MASLFAELTQLLARVRDSEGEILTTPFLGACRQFVLVVGTLAAGFCPFVAGTSGKREALPAPLYLGNGSFLHAEKFGTAFALVKADIGGNIDRLQTAQQKDVSKFEHLFSAILEEVARGEQEGKYSDTNALLWLKRCAPAELRLLLIERPPRPQITS